DDPVEQRPAVGRQRDRDLALENGRAGDDECAVDPEGQVVRLDEAEVLAPPGLLDRAAAVCGERAHDASRMLRIMETIAPRWRATAPIGPGTTISTPSRVGRPGRAVDGAPGLNTTA